MTPPGREDASFWWQSMAPSKSVFGLRQRCRHYFNCSCALCSIASTRPCVVIISVLCSICVGNGSLHWFHCEHWFTNALSLVQWLQVQDAHKIQLCNTFCIDIGFNTWTRLDLLGTT